MHWSHLVVGTWATAVNAATCWRNTTCTGPESAAFPGPWDQYIFAPGSRTVDPTAVLSLPSGEYASDYEDSLIELDFDNQDAVFDFGIEVGGIVTINYAHSGPGARLGVAFTEAKDFIGRDSDNSNGGEEPDGALFHDVDADSEAAYVMPDHSLRGGFRYLTLFLEEPDADARFTITNVTLEIGFQPTWSNLRAYQGYFNSDDELLNKIWYAGAYTLQTNSVPRETGRKGVENAAGWRNDAVIGPGDTVLLDGAKRDRWVWIGDMGTAVSSAFVSTGELESTRNALLAIYDNQADNGVLPKAGPPHLQRDSDTYHLWTLIGTYNYLLFSGDVDFVVEVWPKYRAAMDHSIGLLTEAGIVNVSGEADWGRWTYSTERSSASMLLYRALKTGALIANWIPDLPEAAHAEDEYEERASQLQQDILSQLWDDEVGAFQESPDNSTLHPQDANSMALAFGVVSPAQNTSYAERVSDYLVTRWTPIGPHSPELDNNVSPFISSIELEAHFRAGRPDRALELIHTLWGWYMNHPNGTQSTVPEGFLIDGSWGYRGDRGYRNDPSYVSHAHCWSSGPTSTLTEHMVGLRVTKPAGEQWQLVPATFDELKNMETGFSTKLGQFSAQIEVTDGSATVHWDTPIGTTGWVKLPGEEGEWVDGGKSERKMSMSS